MVRMDQKIKEIKEDKNAGMRYSFAVIPLQHETSSHNSLEVPSRGVWYPCPSYLPSFVRTQQCAHTIYYSLQASVLPSVEWG